MQDRDLDTQAGHSSVKSLALPIYKVICIITQEPSGHQLGTWDGPKHPDDCDLWCELVKAPCLSMGTNSPRVEGRGGLGKLIICVLGLGDPPQPHPILSHRKDSWQSTWQSMERESRRYQPLSSWDLPLHWLLSCP